MQNFAVISGICQFVLWEGQVPNHSVPSETRTWQKPGWAIQVAPVFDGLSVIDQCLFS